MKQPIMNSIAILGLAAFPMSVATLIPKTEVKGKFPDNYIPMFHDNSDAVSTALNTAQITRITPKFDHEGLLSRGKKSTGGVSYLEVQFSNGEKIQVFEPLDEFLERIRRSQP